MRGERTESAQPPVLEPWATGSPHFLTHTPTNPLNSVNVHYSHFMTASLCQLIPCAHLGWHPGYCAQELESHYPWLLSRDIRCRLCGSKGPVNSTHTVDSPEWHGIHQWLGLTTLRFPKAVRTHTARPTGGQGKPGLFLVPQGMWEEPAWSWNHKGRRCGFLSLVVPGVTGAAVSTSLHLSRKIFSGVGHMEGEVILEKFRMTGPASLPGRRGYSTTTSLARFSHNVSWTVVFSRRQ